jgi:hypothetical protein
MPECAFVKEVYLTPLQRTHLKEVYNTHRTGGPTHLEKCTTSRRQGGPPTSKSVQRRHRNLPTLGKEPNPGPTAHVELEATLTRLTATWRINSFTPYRIYFKYF